MKVTLISVLILVFIGCKEHKGYVSKNENGGDETYSVLPEDEEMNKAIEKARNEYPAFVQIFKKGDTTLSDFSVKMRFDYGKNSAEHMWVNELHFRGSKLFGVLDSDPINIHSVKAGDSIAVDETKVSDWMYVKNNKMVGGYTLKVLYNKMTEKEKKEFREQLFFEIE